MGYRYNPFTGELDRVDTTGQPPENRFPTTPYVVGPSTQAGYQTIQSAVNAANAAGGGIVYVQPGTYTENLTLYDNLQIVTFGFSDSGDGVEIIGTHTPPSTGGFVFRNIKLSSSTDVLSSAAAGTSHLIVADCAVAVTNGYLFNVPNWTSAGILEMWDVNSGFGTNDGCVNNTGGATVLCYSGAFGVGSSNSMIVSGDIFTDSAEFFAPTDFQTGATLGIENSIFYNSCTLSNNSTGDITNCSFQTGASAALTMSSAGNISLTTCSISSSASPVIAGAGSGTLTLSGISFSNNSSLSSSLTIVGGNTFSGTYKSDYADHTVILGQGAATDMVASNIATDGQLLIGGVGVDPAFASLTSTGGTITFTPGPNALNLEAAVSSSLTFDTDSGTATPVADTIIMAGGTNMNTSGAGNTVTINLDSDVLNLTRLTVDNLELNGNTLSSTDTNGNINLTPDGTGIIVSDGRGYDVDPGSDTDADLISVSVTGSPVMSWDESNDGFKLNKGTILGDSDGDLTHVINGLTLSTDVDVHSPSTQNIGGISLHRNTSSPTLGGLLIALRSNGTYASPTIVSNGGVIGRYATAGYDGTDYALMTDIQCQVDGTPGNNDMPGRMVFYTSPSGTETPAEAFRLSQDQSATFSGTVTISGQTQNAIPYFGASGLVTELGPLTDGQLIIGATGSTPAAATLASSGGTITITNAANSINLETGGTVASSFLADDTNSAVPAAGVLTVTGAGGITTSASGSTLTINGSGEQVITITSLTSASSPYTVLSSDYYLSCDVSGGVLTINLPNAPTTGKVYIVKDSGGDANTNNITVTTVGGVVTIDGATSRVISTDYAALQFVFNGTSYEVF